MTGIYQITNERNNRKYVGSAINIENRFSRHKIDLKKNMHHSRFMQRDWNKDSSHFIFEVIELTDPSLLISREQHYLDTLHPEYNSCPKAGNWLGMKHRPETIEKMKKIFAGTGNAMYGKRHSDETKKKFSAIHKGKTISDEQKEKMSFALKGRKNPKKQNNE